MAAPAPTITEAPKFDLESYISNYTGRTRFDRLYLIGTTSTVLSSEALKAAVAEAKAGGDVSKYDQAIKTLREYTNDPNVLPDLGWVDKTQKRIKADTDRLEHELKGYKNNLIKESIRMGNEDLGDHFHDTGDLFAATKAYGRMRDHCTTPAHIASMSFKLIHVAVDRGDWLAVQSAVNKIRNLQSRGEEAEKHQPKTSAAMGLSQLALASYRDAANSFLATGPGLSDTYAEVLTSNDVAVYGGLCALASMDRAELQIRVLENTSFRSFLELEPHIRRAISFFCNSKYNQCLEILDAYRTDYLLDLHLHKHVSTLYSSIRTKSIVQYFAPFSCVTLDAMSATFAAAGQRDGKNIEDEIIEMIEQGTLDARIDLEQRVLLAKGTDLRADVHREAQETVKAFTREAHLRLLRMNIINAGLEVKGPGKQQGGGPAGGGFGGGGGGFGSDGLYAGVADVFQGGLRGSSGNSGRLSGMSRFG